MVEKIAWELLHKKKIGRRIPCSHHIFDGSGVCVRCGCGKVYAIQHPHECEGSAMVWFPFPQVKPDHGQVCIVAAGPERQAQHLGLVWDGDDFVWAQDIGLDQFPTELATAWMPWPADPPACLKRSSLKQGGGNEY